MPKRPFVRARPKRQAKKPARYEADATPAPDMPAPGPSPAQNQTPEPTHLATTPTLTAAPPATPAVNDAVLCTILDKLQSLEKKVDHKGPTPSTSGTSPLEASCPVNIDTDSESDPPSQPESGEEASRDDDFDETHDRPLVTFGSAIGSTISTKVRNKILSNKFIEMHELLPNFHTLSNEFTIRPGKHGAQFVLAQPKLVVSFSQWCEGFDVFISIFIEQATSTTSAIKLTKALLTYKKQVTALYKQGYDGAGYDRHFRQEREHQPMSWSTLQADLQLQYAHMPRSNTSRPSNFRPPTPRPATQPSSTTRVMRTPDGHTIPHGHCLSFHSHNERCDRGPQCPYAHKCPKCPIRHPVYRPCPPAAAAPANGQALAQCQPPTGRRPAKA